MPWVEGERELLPERADHDLLARLHLVPAEVPADSQEVLRNIDERRTDRRRFTNWPVPPDASTTSPRRQPMGAGVSC